MERPERSEDVRPCGARAPGDARSRVRSHVHADSPGPRDHVFRLGQLDDVLVLLVPLERVGPVGRAFAEGEDGVVDLVGEAVSFDVAGGTEPSFGVFRRPVVADEVSEVLGCFDHVVGDGVLDPIADDPFDAFHQTGRVGVLVEVLLA